jgi:hypothetical protein
MVRGKDPLHIGGGHKEKRKQANKSGGSKAWLKTRHRVKRKMLR